MPRLSYLVELTIADGQQKAFQEKAKAITTAVKANEPGMLSYDWYLSEDGSRCLLYESFEDSDALMAHLAHVGPTLPDLLAIAPITRFEVMGTASAEAKEALADFGTQHFPHLVGFERQTVAAPSVS